MWLRKEKIFSWKWGTYNLEEVQVQRSEFKGIYDKDEISGQIKKVRKLTEWTRFRSFISISVVIFFVLLVLVAVVALFAYRATLDKSGWGPTLVGIANAI